jgi:hypothetical protein
MEFPTRIQYFIITRNANKLASQPNKMGDKKIDGIFPNIFQIIGLSRNLQIVNKPRDKTNQFMYLLQPK